MNAAIRLPAQDEQAGPVTILDGQGRVLRIVPVDEFRRLYPVAAEPGRAGRTERRARRREPSAGPV
jgi:hypothetical protein